MAEHHKTNHHETKSFFPALSLSLLTFANAFAALPVCTRENGDCTHYYTYSAELNATWEQIECNGNIYNVGSANGDHTYLCD